MWKCVIKSTILEIISKFGNYRYADTKDESRYDIDIANSDISL